MRDDVNLLFLWHFHCFIVISKNGLIVYYISPLLTMVFIAQIVKSKWSLVCQEILDFNIYISPYSYITLNYVSNLLNMSECPHCFICFLSTDDWRRTITYPKRIIYCNAQEWYLNFFLSISVSVLTSWLVNAILSFLKHIFSLKILLTLHLLPNHLQNSLNILSTVLIAWVNYISVVI